MAKRDWKRAVEEAFDALGDRIRDGLAALGDLLSPPPELAPVPVPVRPGDRHRR